MNALEQLAGRLLDDDDLAAEVVRLRRALQNATQLITNRVEAIAGAIPRGAKGRDIAFEKCEIACGALLGTRKYFEGVLANPFPAPPIRDALTAAGFTRLDAEAMKAEEWNPYYEVWQGGEDWEGEPFTLVLTAEEGTPAWREYELKARRFLRAIAEKGE